MIFSKKSSKESLFHPKNWPWDPAHLVLDEDYTYDTGQHGRNWVEQDNPLSITDGIWLIKKGFEWDGTSWVPDGKPDPLKPNYPITWKASLVHDNGYRNMNKKGFPYKKHEIDWYLYLLLKEAGFSRARLYYIGVILFGGIFKFFGRIFK